MKIEDSSHPPVGVDFTIWHDVLREIMETEVKYRDELNIPDHLVLDLETIINHYLMIAVRHLDEVLDKLNILDGEK